jgi:hypothetical protein
MTEHVNWHEDVACRDADPDLFFPIGKTGVALRQREAKWSGRRPRPHHLQVIPPHDARESEPEIR